MPQIEEFRRNQERFHEALHRELLQFYAGQRSDLNVTAVYADYSDLFNPFTIGELKTQIEAIPESFPSRRRSLDRMRRFAVEQFLDARVARFDQEQAGREVSRSFEWNGRSAPFARIPDLLAGEADAGRRRKLQDIRLRMLRDMEDIQLHRLDELQAASARLQYGSALEALQTVAGIDYGALSSTVEWLLAATEPAYQERLAESLGITPGIDPGCASAADAGYWQRHNEPAALFPQYLLTPAFEATFRTLDLEPEGSVTCDLEPRAGKPGGFMCIPVRVPQEVHILGVPAGGREDFACLLHEGGHAHHFGWSSPSLGAEFRLWGDRALCEAFGFLFEHLTLSEGWLLENLGFARPQTYLRFQGLLRCYYVRREIGKLRFALALYGKEGPRDAGERYAEIMKNHTMLDYEPAMWLADASDAFRCADYLRGWLLAAMLGDYLQSKFGTGWHRSGAAGGLLKEIWETGQLYTADELAREVGLGNLDAQILADDLRRGLTL